MSDDSMIIMDGVSFAFPDMAMRFDVAVRAGGVTAVTGPSGSGKSTLLNLIAGFARPDGGRIVLGGQDVTPTFPAERPVSILFQDNNLFAHLSVEVNAGFGIAPQVRFEAPERARIHAALARVGLAGKEKRLPHELSGGERQRAAFARALLQDRPILLLDEPFASLGPSLRMEMMELIGGLQAEKPRTILAVTHHPLEWAGLADAYLFVAEGHILAKGPMSELANGKGPEALGDYLGTARTWPHSQIG